MNRTSLIVRFGSIALLGGVLGACASGGTSSRFADSVATTPTEQFSIEVRQQPDEIRLAAHANGLSPAQQEALASLADRWRDRGAGPMVIQDPGNGVAAGAAHQFLLSRGVPPGAIQVVSYQPPQGAGPVLVVGYAGYQAFGPTCGRGWENLARNGGNNVYSEFGCSVTANMAAQIARPGDLISPAALDPADADRRATVIGKYRKGEVTAAQRDKESTGVVSNTSAGSGN